MTREVPVIVGEHVTLDAGTGAVHTAPGHGLEDYIVGQRYGLPVDNPVGGDGRFLPDTPLFAGENVFQANEQVVETLKAKGALLLETRFTHSYPHCWRHKTPIIFRATPQWFISMDKQGLRETALREIEQGPLDARLGSEPHRGHGPRTPGLVHLAPAHLGRAHRAASSTRKPASSTRARPS